MVKLRLEYLRSLGLRVEKDTVVSHGMGGVSYITDEKWDDPKLYKDLLIHIEAFTDVFVNGTQPVPDEIPVSVWECGGERITALAKDYCWKNYEEGGRGVFWRPDIDKLKDMQDKQDNSL